VTAGESTEAKQLIRKRRSIHRSLITSEKVNTLDECREILFTRLILTSDDEGRQCGSPFTVKMVCLPGRNWTLAEVEEGLEDLDDTGLIIWYVVDEKWFIQMLGWEEHQSFHGVKRFPSELPPPPGWNGNGEVEHQNDDELVDKDTDLTPESEIPVSGCNLSVGKGKGKGKGQEVEGIPPTVTVRDSPVCQHE
jgi:hypothetical protein